MKQGLQVYRFLFHQWLSLKKSPIPPVNAFGTFWHLQAHVSLSTKTSRPTTIFKGGIQDTIYELGCVTFEVHSVHCFFRGKTIIVKYFALPPLCSQRGHVSIQGESDKLTRNKLF
ncbi:hypothetical protein NPIL_664771 [Nephila pilipes]|uniref:Uncharacterized protein n=1 Tax=Nephila pilipes TaxID=299642 RepID=A0A8X6Q244_NEPPI|nr:hypothetical protein NPIL_664771 [Nephila pilipes]